MRSDFNTVDRMEISFIEWFTAYDAMIRNTREIISPLSTRILVQFAYSPITIIRDAFNIKSSLIQRLIEHEPMIQMPS